MIYQNRNINVKVTIRFFNLKNHVIHATDKTEIELDDEVSIYTLCYTYFSKQTKNQTKKFDIITMHYNNYIFI